MPVLAKAISTLQSLADVVRRVDDTVREWMAATDHGALRPVLSASAGAAGLLLPWVAASQRLVMDGTPTALGALARGWTGMAMAAVVENGVLKPAVHRGRPDANRLPPGQRRGSEPSTSAFPSGHTGAAVAFAVASRRDVPDLWPYLAGTALVVAYTEVYTGRHYFSDALVGGAIGALVGALAQRLPVGRSG